MCLKIPKFKQQLFLTRHKNLLTLHMLAYGGLGWPVGSNFCCWYFVINMWHNVLFVYIMTKKMCFLCIFCFCDGILYVLWYDEMQMKSCNKIHFDLEHTTTLITLIWVLFRDVYFCYDHPYWHYEIWSTINYLFDWLFYVCPWIYDQTQSKYLLTSITEHIIICYNWSI